MISLSLTMCKRLMRFCLPEMIIVRFCFFHFLHCSNHSFMFFFFLSFKWIKKWIFSLRRGIENKPLQLFWVTMFDISHSFISVCMSTELKSVCILRNTKPGYFSSGQIYRLKSLVRSYKAQSWEDKVSDRATCNESHLCNSAHPPVPASP